jgi:putative PIN family toxin of toxin-antitoxin system
VRVLLDTNVLISAILFGGLPRELLELAIRGHLDPVTSPSLLDEFEDVLVEKFGFPRGVAGMIRSELESLSDLHQPEEVPTVLSDRLDNEVLATASTARAEAIVTGDRELLALRFHLGIPILSPRELMKVIET